MANKTIPTEIDPADFVASVEHDVRRGDAEVLLELMERLSGCPPKMWGPSIVGYDEYHYVYESGREGDFLKVGFSPRKANMVLYLLPGYDEAGEMLDRLGKHKIGKSCLYINKLADVDLAVLEELIVAALAHFDSE